MAAMPATASRRQAVWNRLGGRSVVGSCHDFGRRRVSSRMAYHVTATVQVVVGLQVLSDGNNIELVWNFRRLGLAPCRIAPKESWNAYERQGKIRQLEPPHGMIFKDARHMYGRDDRITRRENHKCPNDHPRAATSGAEEDESTCGGVADDGDEAFD